jgi:hypothetical protein
LISCEGGPVQFLTPLPIVLENRSLSMENDAVVMEQFRGVLTAKTPDFGFHSSRDRDTSLRL